MKNISNLSVLVLILAVLAAGCNAPAVPTLAKPTQPPPPLPPPPPPNAVEIGGGARGGGSGGVLFFGHRGAGGEAPENTLAAFKKGLEDGVNAIELDVHLTKDGELAVMHDPRLDRTSDGTGLIKDFAMTDLKKLNAAAKYKGTVSYGVQPIPTLQEVYDLAGKKARLVIEIKVDEKGARYPGIEQKVVDLVRRNDAVARTTVGSFDIDTMKEMQRLEPGIFRLTFISTAYLGQASKNKQGPEQIAADLKAAGLQGVGVDKAFLSAALVTALKGAGLQVGAWTVDDAAEMWKLVDLGVETITTNNPALLMDKYKEGRKP
jgi:glycerophosphoryl diester phosphodiesterase